MTAIFGLIASDGRFDLEKACAEMGRAQQAYGPHACDLRRSGHAAAGRCLYRLLPEDRFDSQPLVGGEGRFLLVADIRLDNRAELVRALSLDEEARLSDADILLRALERWDERVFEHIAGEYAFAWWDAERSQLVLARDPLGRRPLHFHRGQDFVAFASMPQGLHALPEIPRAPDLRRVAEFLLDAPRGDGNGFFLGVSRVRPGHLVTFAGDRIVSKPHWEPQLRELRLRSRGEYIEAFRAELDRAVECRLRGADGRVAAHLSSGLDSSAVATTAARLLLDSGGSVTAFTAAPRQGFSGPAPKGHVADESAIAATTAAFHPNMEHVVVRSTGVAPFDLFDRYFELFQEPATNVCNQVWVTAIEEAMRSRGLHVALNGGLGNYTISAGSVSMLADLLRRGRLRHWATEAWRLSSNGTVGWRGAAAYSFAPWLPAAAWRFALGRFADGPSDPWGADIVHERWRAAGQGAPALVPKPARNTYAERLRLLRQTDPGNFIKGALAGWGVEERDPTTDPRLIEFCLSIPPEQLIRGGTLRSLCKDGLADRVPRPVLQSRTRGYQGADWYEAVSPPRLESELAAARASPATSALLSLERLQALVESWPPKDWAKPQANADFRIRMLHAFSAAHFVRRASD